MVSDPREAKMPPEPVALEDLAHDLGLLESDTRGFVNELGIPIVNDYRGRPAVSSDSAEKIAEHPRFLAAAQRAIASDQKAWLSTDVEKERQTRLALLSKYEQYIDDLEKIHRRYRNQANLSGAESSGMAAYLLLGRVICMLRTTCLCLRHGYWYCGGQIREIDEALDLARYLCATKSSSAGEATRRNWFRLNRSPKHSEIRRGLAEWGARLQGAGADTRLDLSKEVYRKKSKLTHPTYLVIREVTDYDSDGLIAGFTYDRCSREDKLTEFTDFFRSSVWSAFQVTGICFILEFNVEDEDRQAFLDYDSMFRSWNEE